MKEIGKIIYKMEKVLKHGLMVEYIKELIVMDKKKEKELCLGKMVLVMKENLISIKLMEKAYIYLMTKESIQENGKIIK